MTNFSQENKKYGNVLEGSETTKVVLQLSERDGSVVYE